MAIEYQVLGAPGRDNALWVRVNSGQTITRLLFDCGDGCLSGLPLAEIHSADHLLFSHLHMDHVAGFDQFFRCNFNRDAKPNVIWGPPDTAAAMHHRFQGFWWNLHGGQPGTWRVHDVDANRVASYRYEIAEAFANEHDEGRIPHTGTILETKELSVEIIQLDHHGPCLGYLLREKPRSNVQTERLESLGLRPGPWMKALKDEQTEGSVEIDGQPHALVALRETLLKETPGDSIAYLTDFRLDAVTEDRLVAWLDGCQTVICEAQYRHSDLELANRHAHLTTTLVGQLAARAQIESLVLFHLSERYHATERQEMLEECRALFPNTSFPQQWQLAAEI